MNTEKKRSRSIRPLKMFFDILRQSHTYKILVGYIIMVFVMGLLIMIMDENIDNYGDALWYCYAVLSTVGFGDIVVTGTVPRILSVILTVYSTVVIAIITGAIVNLYIKINEMRMEETMESFVGELEHLQELDKDELSNLSKRIADFRNRLRE